MFWEKGHANLFSWQIWKFKNKKGKVLLDFHVCYQVPATYDRRTCSATSILWCECKNIKDFFTCTCFTRTQTARICLAPVKWCCLNLSQMILISRASSYIINIYKYVKGARSCTPSTAACSAGPCGSVNPCGPGISWILFSWFCNAVIWHCSLVNGSPWSFSANVADVRVLTELQLWLLPEFSCLPLIAEIFSCIYAMILQFPF